MSLVRFIYISDATAPISDSALYELNRLSSLNNERRGITGLLLYSAGNFMQVLEGENLQVTSLYTKISADPRHRQTRQLMHRPVKVRLFPSWGMQLINANHSAALDRDRIDKALVHIRLAGGDAASDAIALLNEFRSQFKSPVA